MIKMSCICTAATYITQGYLRRHQQSRCEEAALAFPKTSKNIVLFMDNEADTQENGVKIQPYQLCLQFRMQQTGH